MPHITHRRISPPSNKKEYDNRRNNKYSKYYHNKKWKLLREWQITNFPLCYDCLFNGISKPAEEVHHKIPWSRGNTEEEKIALLTDPNNVVSLCKECHDKRHAQLNHKQ